MFPKRALVAVLVTGLGGLAAWRAANGESFRVQIHPVTGLFAAWWGWNVVSMVWAPSPSLAFERVVWLSIVGLAMLLLQNQCLGRRGAIVRLSRWFIGAAALLSVWVLIMDFWALASPGSVPVVARLGDWRDRISAAGLGNTGHIADFIVIAFPAALMTYLHRWDRFGRTATGVALALMAAALIVCWSVHSNAGLILVVVLGLAALLRLHRARWWKRRMKRIALLCAVWAGVVVFYVAPHPLNPHPGGIFHEAFSSPRWKEGGPTRLAIWETTIQMIRERPLVGVGAGNFPYVYPSIVAPAVRENPELARYAHRWTNAAHNEILQSWAETGIVGLLLLLALVGGALYIAIRRMKEETAGNRMVLWCATLALGAWCLHGQMSFPLQMPVATLWFGLLLSVPVALPPRHRRNQGNILFPVELERAGVRLTIYMKNMRIPTRLSLELMWSGIGRRLVGVVAAGLFAGVVVVGGRGLAAQVAMRQGRQAAAPFLQPQFGVSREVSRMALDQAGPHYKKALTLWPWLTDARSAWTDLLVRAGKFDEAALQNDLVRRRLDATEVYFREAWSRLNLGQPKVAADAIAVIRERSVPGDINNDGIPDNLAVDPFWAAVYIQLIKNFPAR